MKPSRDGVLVAGRLRAALAADARPVPDVGGRRRGQQRAFPAQGGRGRDPVVTVRSPARARISAVRVMLASRRRRAARSWDQAIMSPGWRWAGATASARLVSVMIRSVPAAAARQAAIPWPAAGPGPVIAEQPSGACRSAGFAGWFSCSCG